MHLDSTLSFELQVKSLGQFVCCKFKMPYYCCAHFLSFDYIAALIMGGFVSDMPFS